MKGRAPTSLPPSLSTLRLCDAFFIDASGTLLGGSPLTGDLEIYPDAHLLLQGFRARKCAGRNIKTGLITNWGKRVHSALAHFDLASAFDAVVCADDVRAGKPHPEIFALAASLVEIPADKCMHVGDSLWDDALGAQNAGWQGVWLARDGKAGMREREHFGSLTKRPPLATSLEEFWNTLDSLR